MGANLQIVGFEDKIKTREQALKDLATRSVEARYEYGNSGYTGTIAELNFRYIGTVFNTYDDFNDYLSEKSTGDGYLAQVKVIRETKPLIAAREKAKEAGLAIWQAQREKKAPSVIRTLTARRDKAAEKVRAITLAQAEKSTKTRWIAGGWASE